MDYFRSLLPTGGTPAPPPSLRASPDTLRSPASSEQLSPPPSQLDESDPPPYVPDASDHTSLNQVEGQSPQLLGDLNPRVYHQRSSSSDPGENGDISQSSPATPRPAWARGWSPSPRRRSSMPTKTLRRLANLYNSPETDTPAEEDERMDHVRFRSPCSLEEVPLDKAATQALRELEIPYEIVGKKSVKDHQELVVPLEIRLRRPSTRPGPAARRKSLPARSCPPHYGFVTSKDSLLQDSINSGMAKKCATASPAVTHLSVHNFVADDEAMETSTAGDLGQRRLSATLQIVRSKDSVYEVIWEDNVALHAQDDACPTSKTPSPGSSTSNSPAGSQSQTPRRSSISDVSRIGHVDTTMAGWSWGGEMPPSSVASYQDQLFRHVADHLPTSHSRFSRGEDSRHDQETSPVFFMSEEDNNEDMPLPVHYMPDGEYDSVDQDIRSNHVSISRKMSVSSEESTPDPTDPLVELDKEDSEMEINDSITRRRNSCSSSVPSTHLSIATAPPSPPSPATSPRPSADSQQRLHLLGNRKISDYVLSDDHFAGHRDSLILTHKRISHDEIRAQHAISISSEHHVGSLKSTSWSLKDRNNPADQHNARMQPAMGESSSSRSLATANGILVGQRPDGLGRGLRRLSAGDVLRSPSGTHLSLMIEDLVEESASESEVEEEETTRSRKRKR